MIRTATEEWTRRLGRPLYLLINQSRGHALGTYSPVRAGALAVTAHLAYCKVGDEERADVERATIVPSFAFQRIVQTAGDLDIRAVLATLDFPQPIIVRTRRFVALGLPAGAQLFIGVRGTVGAYDWSVNARMWPKRGTAAGLPLYFHAGFLAEAALLAAGLKAQIAALRQHAALEQVFLSGHSLGGAIAAILHQQRRRLLPYPAPSTAGDCYIFGAPRTVWRNGQAFLDQPFAVRRPDDFIPRVPPASLGYKSYREQLLPDGAPFRDRGLIDWWPFLKWIDTLSFGKFVDGHSMERYRAEVLNSARAHPDVTYWPDDLDD